MAENIPLMRAPRPEDLEDVITLAEEDCLCSRNMKDNLKHGDETVCKPCAARQVLNGLTSLSDEMK